MDIRRYFGSNPSKSKPSASSSKPCPSKKEVSNTDSKDTKKVSRKRTAVVIDSDSDEEPIPKRSITNSRSSSIIIDDSDDDFTPAVPAKSVAKKEVVPVKQEKPAPKPKVSPSDFFGKAPVHRSGRPAAEQKKVAATAPVKVESAKKPSSTGRDLEFDTHDDEDFAATLRALDATETKSNKKDETKKRGEVKNTSSLVTPKKEFSSSRVIEKPVGNGIDVGKKSGGAAKAAPEKSSSVSKTAPEKSSSASKTSKVVMTAKKTVKVSPETPKTVSAKKTGNSTAYLHYLNREGPTAPGSKDIPKGEEGCFEGLTFVITGVMESLERSELEDLVRQYGGKVTLSISGKTSYLIVGSRDAGVSKLAQAEAKKTKRLSEDEFLDLIRTRPGKKTPGSSGKKVNGTASTSTISAPSSKKSLQFGETSSATSVVGKLDSPKASNKTSLNSSNSPKDKSGDKRKSEEVKSASSSATSSPATSTSPADSKRPRTMDADSGSRLMWVDKYKPVSTSQIIGQQGDNSNVKKLRKWLDSWHVNHSKSGGAKPKAAAFKFGGGGNGAIFKAALLSGPPGVGKTTSAQLVCKEAGFTFVELNASDTRSKKSLQEIVAQMVGNTSLAQYIEGNVQGAQNHCLLMDEVDGMAGNEDRGGMQELIQLIKKSKIPVICMCNDRMHMKIRSLANYCFDLRFGRPTMEQLRGAMMSVCFKEKLDINSQAVQEIVLGAGQDVRQVLHHLSMWSVKTKGLTVEEASAEAKKSKKDTKKNIFDVTRMVFSANDHKDMNIHDRANLFFNDYSMTPLFVQENFLYVRPADATYNSTKHLQLASQAADSICDGDLVEKLVRSGQEWGLLPLQATC